MATDRRCEADGFDQPQVSSVRQRNGGWPSPAPRGCEIVGCSPRGGHAPRRPRVWRVIDTNWLSPLEIDDASARKAAQKVGDPGSSTKDPSVPPRAGRRLSNYGRIRCNIDLRAMGSQVALVTPSENDLRCLSGRVVRIGEMNPSSFHAGWTLVRAQRHIPSLRLGHPPTEARRPTPTGDSPSPKRLGDRGCLHFRQLDSPVWPRAITQAPLQARGEPGASPDSGEDQHQKRNAGCWVDQS